VGGGSSVSEEETTEIWGRLERTSRCGRCLGPWAVRPRRCASSCWRAAGVGSTRPSCRGGVLPVARRPGGDLPAAGGGRVAADDRRAVGTDAVNGERGGGREGGSAPRTLGIRGRGVAAGAPPRLEANSPGQPARSRSGWTAPGLLEAPGSRCGSDW